MTIMFLGECYFAWYKKYCSILELKYNYLKSEMNEVKFGVGETQDYLNRALILPQVYLAPEIEGVTETIWL